MVGKKKPGSSESSPFSEYFRGSLLQPKSCLSMRRLEMVRLEKKTSVQEEDLSRGFKFLISKPGFKEVNIKIQKDL